MKKTIGLIYGGRSGEHEVSVVSARNIARALDASKYKVLPIGIDKKGHWRMDSEKPLRLLDEKNTCVPTQATEVQPRLHGENGCALASVADGSNCASVDVFFPILHGSYGEDGCLQGMLRMLEAPFVGADVTGSAIGMDKELAKRLLRDAGLPIGRFVCLRGEEAREASYDVFARELGKTFFVKPCAMGSSVGIHRVSSPGQFDKAVRDALQYDRKILFEENIPGREIEVAVLGNQEPRASRPGEIVLGKGFYSYKAKYQDESGVELHAPARLETEEERTVRELAIRVYECLECQGMARVDFFLHPERGFVVNEINTLPGFTDISMYPRLWKAEGLGTQKLLDELIALAEESYAERAALRRDFKA